MSTGQAPGFDWEDEDWLVGCAAGVWRGRPGAGWQPVGTFGVNANRVLRAGAGVLVAGGDGGLWLGLAGDDRWRQLHDETLTMVQDVAVDCGAGLVAPGRPDRQVPALRVATGYGVHRPRAGDHGAWRWDDPAAGCLDMSARFALRLQPLDDDGRRWLAGTEAGLWHGEDDGNWTATAIADTGVRALLRLADGLWAGTDDGGLWHSVNGSVWTCVDRAPHGAGVLSLDAPADGGLLVGTTAGAARRTPDGVWTSTGPSLAVAAIAADVRQPGTWALGAAPGGLWWTTDGGRHWQQEADIIDAVRDLSKP